MKDRISILGAGESGVGAALLAKAKGFDVFVSDCGQIKENYKQKLISEEIPFEENIHTPELIFQAKEIVISPGIPDKADIVKAAKKNKINIVSEIEFAGRYTKAKKICITGTNGKTTTTLLTHHLLKKAGINAALAGNVGNSFAEMVLEDKYDVYVLELSSFQLDRMYNFKADIAIITNITPDHLDRYDYKVENYVRAKFRIIQNMDPNGVFIYNEDSPLLFDELINVDIDARELPFSIEECTRVAAWGNEKMFYINPRFDYTSDQNNTNDIITINHSKSTLKGKHNLYNAMAASLAAACMGATKEQIEAGLRDFVNAPHRMEIVAQINGVTYINDSKATNVDSAYYALEAVHKPIIWIVGGVDKGNDYAQLMELVKKRVKAIVCLGKDNATVVNAFRGAVKNIYETHDMATCVQQCNEIAQDGDVVLLSPCCASFDLFKNYEDRGEQFKKYVKLNCNPGN
ncbi:MAG: UDP-N-acetylmuramoyl-L-alanine--D-glutamate ligase [Cytophagaceae bacterium]|nr:UDP-N-acetylmuramoyl-L-alanine--D-glutamate ligase [Cytophagaceae bacterium]MDW8455420.1 UDP-N-acetylmuramoyl-L-alanine--D-glutamate ligase [Cytophagaceae bacterium]